MAQEAVIIEFVLPEDKSIKDVHELADDLVDDLGDLEAEYDGDEYGPSDRSVTLFFYGESAEDMFECMQDTLESTDVFESAVITLRDEDGDEEELEIG